MFVAIIPVSQRGWVLTPACRHDLVHDTQAFLTLKIIQVN